jgi:Ni,Fe-hydrogenase maturation factor
MGLPVGAVRWIMRDDITGFGGSTHLTPLIVLADYFSNEFTCECFFIGIQPGGMEFDHKISVPVRQAAYRAARMIFSNSFGIK